MIPKDLTKNIRRIEIATSRLVTDVFAGQYKSTFRGRGMEFDEVREYLPGDDVRTIDWNVTARTGVPHIKKYVEERELTAMILVDASPSCRFGTSRELKSRLAAELAAVLAFSAIRNNDKIGLIIFTDGIETFIPPRKGRSHVLRIIREVLYFEPKGRGTDIAGAIDFLNKVTTRRCVAFLVSDLIETGTDLLVSRPTFARSLSAAARRHDFVAVSLNDPREYVLPDCGVMCCTDPENGNEVVVDTSSVAARQLYTQKAARRSEARTRMLRSLNVDHVELWTHQPFVDKLVRFFSERRRRVR